MKTPAESATPDNPLVIEVDGERYELWAASAGVSSSGPARFTQPYWTISFGGTRYGGWAAHVDESVDDIRDELRAWLEARREVGT